MSDLTQKYSQLDWRERKALREAYTRKQDYKCYYCKQPLSRDPDSTITSRKVNWRLFPPNFLKYPIHLQHNHKTDDTEGAVHAYCNAVMWQYEGR